jgi:tetratricopeptide (TPR) repeat protein
MNTEDDQIGKTRSLRATIGIITRGGPITVNTYQDTKPVMLKGMQLPAEACYSFKDPTDHSSNLVNHPISIELFFGENGEEDSDISLGKFQLQEFLPPFASSTNIELRLAVSSDQILSITLLDAIPQRSRSIGFVDISALDPPAIKPTPKVDASEDFKKTYQHLLEMVENPQPRQTGNPRRGRDLAQDVTISFGEALHGGSKDIEVVGTQTCPACTGSGTVSGRTLCPCPDCMGTGWAREMKETSDGPQYRLTVCTTCRGDGLVNTYPCPTCRGNGWVRIKRSFTLQIPAHIDSGAVICILNQGEPGQFGGLPGHLRITVDVAAHPFLTRSGRDICVELPVSASIAKQGGRLRVPALEMGHSFLLDLPAKTRSNAVFRVSENEAYSLIARIETYRPAFLSMRPNINQRIQAIREWLGGADIETPTADESDLDERVLTAAVPAMAGSTPAPGRSTHQAGFYTRRGMIYAEKGDRDRSLADFNMALELDPEYASAYDHRGAWYVIQREPGKALADMNRALELAPNNAEYYYHRGMLQHIQEDWAKALADYTKALELDSTNAEIYESRGKVYTLQSDLEAALADFNRALELDPTRVYCYHQRGVMYQHKNDLARTIADFTKALELDPGNDQVRSDRGQVYVQLNDLENALADASKLAEKHPENARAYNNRGYIYYLQGDFAKALADYDKALELDPRFAYAYNNRGKTYLKQTRYRQAIEDFDRSLLLHPGDSWLYLWVGQAYRGLGEKKKAIEYCQKASHTCQNPELRQEAHRLLSDLGLE